MERQSVFPSLDNKEKINIILQFVVEKNFEFQESLEKKKKRQKL
jgi:hypothetical protein